MKKQILILLLAAIFVLAACQDKVETGTGGNASAPAEQDPLTLQGAALGEFLTAKFQECNADLLNANGTLERDDANIDTACQNVLAYAEQLRDLGVIEGVTYCAEGGTVSVFLKDGSTYVYTPPVADCNADWEFTVTSVDALGAVDDFVISTLSGSGAEDAAETIDNDVLGYTEWTAYGRQDVTVARLKGLLRGLQEDNVRVLFWRGHGNIYAERDGTIHCALATCERRSDEADETYAEDLHPASGEKTLCFFKNGYGINENFFKTYAAQVDGGLFYCGSCCSALADGALAKILLDKGFDAFCGANGEIFTLYSDKLMGAVAEKLCEKDDLGSYRTISDAFSLAQDECGVSDFFDMGVRMVLFENPDDPPFRVIPELVSERVFEKVPGWYDQDAEFHIPVINLDYPQVDAINEKVFSELNGYLERAKQETPELQNCDGVSYTWYVNEDILSLVVREDLWPMATPNSAFQVYNIRLSTGEMLDSSDILEARGMSYEEYADLAFNAFGSLYCQTYSGGFDGTFDGGSTLYSQLEKTISQENIAQTPLYLGEDGHLCGIVVVYSIAGAGAYPRSADLEAVELSPYFTQYLQRR